MNAADWVDVTGVWRLRRLAVHLQTVIRCYYTSILQVPELTASVLLDVVAHVGDCDQALDVIVSRHTHVTRRLRCLLVARPAIGVITHEHSRCQTYLLPSNWSLKLNHVV